jgi:hypothetical protein
MKKILLITFIFTSVFLQSQTLIKSEWIPAKGDSASVVELRAPMVYETIQRFVWSQRANLIEDQSRAFLKFELIIEAGNVDTAIMSHLIKNFSITIYNIECYDYVKIVDLYEYQIQFTK